MAGLQQSLSTGSWIDAVTESAAILGVDGLAVSILDQNQVNEVLWHSGDLSSTFEDLQFTVGQGLAPMRPAPVKSSWSRTWRPRRLSDGPPWSPRHLRYHWCERSSPFRWESELSGWACSQLCAVPRVR